MNIQTYDRFPARHTAPARPRRAANAARRIHPSWLERDYQQATGDLVPDEFWARLGM